MVGRYRSGRRLANRTLDAGRQERELAAQPEWQTACPGLPHPSRNQTLSRGGRAGA